MSQISENSEDLELFHYGVKGMRWGVTRKVGSDGLAEGKPPGPKKGVSGAASKVAGRVARAKVQENENLIKFHKTIKNREGGKVVNALSAPDRIVLGKKRFEKYHDTHINALTKQNDRIKSGKTTVSDKLDIALNTSLYSVIKAG